MQSRLLFVIQALKDLAAGQGVRNPFCAPVLLDTMPRSFGRAYRRRSAAMSEDGFQTEGVAWGFERESVTLAVDAILPMKTMRPDVKLSAKYRQILTSVRAVGLVEPPAVARNPAEPGSFFLVDGHLRLEALRDLGIPQVICLVATDDEAFTYNKRVNRLSAPQEHRMIVRAIERGVPAGAIGRGARVQCLVYLSPSPPHGRD